MNKVIRKAEFLKEKKIQIFFFSFKVIVKHSVSRKQTTIDFGQNEVSQERQKRV